MSEGVVFRVSVGEIQHLRTSSFANRPLDLWHVFGLLVSRSVYCKSRIFRMLFIFVYFVCGGFCRKLSCV